MSWWERWHGALEEELDALERVGAHPVRDEEALKDGNVLIHISATIQGEERQIEIRYPDLFPYFRPDFFTYGLNTHTHYNPMVGHMCLLGRDTGNWSPGMTAADLYTEQVPKWDQIAFQPRTGPALEGDDAQAEPFSAYYQVLPFMAIMVDSTWDIGDEVLEGSLKIVFRDNISKSIRQKRLLGLVVEVKEKGKDEPLYVLQEPLSGWAQKHLQGQTLQIPWFRLEKPLVAEGLQPFIDHIKSHNPAVFQSRERSLRNGKPVFIAFSFPEERERGVLGEGWIFLLCIPEKKQKKGTLKVASFLVGAEPFGAKDLFERIPNLHPLRQKRVGIVGLGCLGAPSAIMLAQSGVGELALIDSDHISPGTICRTPYEHIMSGMPKMEVLADRILKDYPFTRVRTSHYPPDQNGQPQPAMHIGRITPSYDQNEYLEKFLEGVDLIYDATAEEGIHHLLADRARDKGIPYIFLSSRPGGMGGIVGRLKPDGSNGCFACFSHHLHDGSIPEPIYDEKADVQAAGCGDVSFHAPVFDVGEVALTAVRLAVSTLCEGTEEGYPPTEWDVAVLTLLKDGKIVAPSWEMLTLSKHPQCSC